MEPTDRSVGSPAEVDGATPPWYPGEADPVIREDLRAIVAACEVELARLAGKAVLVTGGSGFIGRYLVESILHHASRSGDRCVIGLPTRRPDALRARYPDHIRDGSLLVFEWPLRPSSRFGDVRWDYVVHAAAPADPGHYLRDTYGALRDITDLALFVSETARASHSERIVLVSSGAVYGRQPTDLPALPETYPGGPDTSEAAACYGEGKRLTELLCGLSGVDCRIARLFSLIGPYQDLGGSFAVPTVIRQAAEQGAIRLDGDGTAIRNYSYAADTAITLLQLLLGAPRWPTYNLGSRDGTVSIAEVARLVSEIFGGLPITYGAHPDQSGSAPSRYVPDIDRLNRDAALAEPTTGVREGLLRTCRSLHRRGLIPRVPAIA